MGCGADSIVMAKMLIATSLNIGVSRGPLPAVIARVARAGFDGVDFHFCDLLDACDWTDECALAAYVEPLRAAAENNRLKWVQGHGPMFNMFGESPFDKRARELCVPSIRAAGRLGVPWMVFHPDVFPGAFDLAHRKRIVDANMAFFQSLLPECERNGVGNCDREHLRLARP